MKTNTIEARQTPWQATNAEQSQAERRAERKKRTHRALLLGAVATFTTSVLGVAVEKTAGEVSVEGAGKTVTKTIDGIRDVYVDHQEREQSKLVYDVDDANVATYRESLRQVVEEDATYTGSLSPSTSIEVVHPDGGRHGYTIDDDPRTAYVNNPSATQLEEAFDYVHPALIDAAGIEEIHIKDLKHAIGDYPPGADVIRIDSEFAQNATPGEIANTIHHEAAHALHYAIGENENFPELVDFESENPAWWNYQSEYPEDSAAHKEYDMDKNSEGITVRWYGTKSPEEDFAEYTAAIFDKGTFGVDGQAENYRNYLRDNNELTIDKSAATMAILEKYQPGLGTIALDQVENNFDHLS